MKNKKLVNKILINEKVDVDMNVIDMDSFGETLLRCIPKIEDFCKTIDSQVYKMATIPFIPYVNTTEQCDYIIDSIKIKSELVNLHKTFSYWYDLLTYKNKQLFVAYFINRDVNVYKQKDRAARPLIRAFMRFLHIMMKSEELKLIKNPYIYNTYVSVLEYNTSKKKGGFGAKKGGTCHDGSTNEKRYS